MDHLAENRLTITKSLFTEGMLRISRDSYGAGARKTALALIAIWVAVAAYTVWSGGGLIHTVAYLIPFGLIILWSNVLLPRNQVKRMWKSQEMTHGPGAERLTRFYEDRLVITGTGVNKEIPYDQILSVKYSRHLVILLCENKMGILLARDGFSGEPLEQLLQRIFAGRNN